MPDMNQSPFQVDDFSGGITDDVFQQVYNRAAIIDNFHVTSDFKLRTRPGSVVDSKEFAQLPSGATRVSALINYANNDKLLAVSTNKVYYRNTTNWTTLTGPSGNFVFSSGSNSSAPAFAQWNKHIFVTNDSYPKPMKIYKDENAQFQVRNSGLPGLATSPVVTKGAAGNSSFIYAFHYSYSYFVADQEFQDVGPVTQVQVTNSANPQTNPNSISLMPQLTNSAGDNYATSSIKIEIYRTIDGGTAFWKLGEVANGTTTFTDNFSDASINGLVVELYTDDGTVDFDPAPAAKFVGIVNNTAYYCNISEDGQINPFRIRQSIPGAPSAAPLDFYIDLEDEITGISSVRSLPIVFTKKYVYRIDGSFDQFGRGVMTPVRIHDTSGAVSHNSCVAAEGYLFYASTQGIFATDGYQTTKISDLINERYKSIISNQAHPKFIYAKYDEKERRIYWAVQSESGSSDNDSFLVLDLRYGVKADSCFTTWSGSSFRPTAIEYFNNTLYRGDLRGYVLYHGDEFETDPKIDSSKQATEWTKETIIWTYQSINVNFGNTMFRKMPTRFLLAAANIANTTIQVSAISDDGRKKRDLSLIRWQRNFTWGDDTFVWGNAECQWKGVGLLEQWRRFPAGGLRVSYLSIVITNGFGVIANSDEWGAGVCDASDKTITLEPMSIWPDDSVDYYVSTDEDDYTKNYLVISRDSDTKLTVVDPMGTFPSGMRQWVLRGYRKGEPLQLVGYNVFWQDVSQTQGTFRPSQLGGNA